MHNLSRFLLASTLGISFSLALINASRAEGIRSGLVFEAGFGCNMQGGKLVCGDKKSGSKKSNDDDDDDGDDAKPKSKARPDKCGKKVRCEPGFVVLEKPNKYGACCEAREGLPPPQAAEAEKCKFPGEVGTPPNCTCPPNTEFLGYKGCVKVRFPAVCTGNKPSPSAEEYWARQKKECKGTFTCSSKGELKECCCTEKVYDE